MNSDKNKVNKTVTILEINQKLITIDRLLLDLRIKKVTQQNFKPHTFKKLKKERAQLLTLKNKPK